MLKSLLAVAAFSMVVGAVALPARAANEKGPLAHTVKDIDGKDVDLSKYKGKVVMFVNVASKCGNTPQYKQLEELNKKYADKGLVILGFPANEFKNQEPGTEADIKQFCTEKYNVTFPMFSKVVVKGDGMAPVYQALTSDAKFAGPVTWNFEKFLVGRDGQVAARFTPKTKPDAPEVVAKVVEELAKK